MGELGGGGGGGSGQKLWVAVCVAELAVIVILATGLGFLWTHKEEGQALAETVEGMNQTLQLAADNWQACQNRTRSLAADSSLLRYEVTQLGFRLQQQEGENKFLRGELAVLKNWTLHLEDLNRHHKEVIARLIDRPEAFSGTPRNNRPPFPVLLPVAVAVVVARHL